MFAAILAKLLELRAVSLLRLLIAYALAVLGGFLLGMSCYEDIARARVRRALRPRRKFTFRGFVNDFLERMVELFEFLFGLFVIGPWIGRALSNWVSKLERSGSACLQN